MAVSHYAINYGSQEDIDQRNFEVENNLRPIKVICKKCGYVDENDTEFINIEEDFQGADVLTFKCKCGEVRKSRRFG